MKQAQQIGSRIGVLNDQLRGKRAHGSSGGGMVQVEVNGLGEVLRLTIDPKLIENNERDMIEDLVPAAVNQAIQRSKELYAEAVKSLTEGIQIPGLDDALAKFTSGSSSI
jgi:DNA-binding YbaB/EbfC family protein